MLLKIGSRGNEVKELQEFLGIGADGIFGKGTAAAVKEFQKLNGLGADGIVGPATWDCMGLATTDNSEKTYTTSLIQKLDCPKYPKKILKIRAGTF